MKRTLLAVGLVFASFTAFAASSTPSAKDDTLAQTVTSLCQDAGVTKADMPKCEKRVQAIAVNAVIAHNFGQACLNSPEKVKEYGLNEDCEGYIRDSTALDSWKRDLLSTAKP